MNTERHFRYNQAFKYNYMYIDLDQVKVVQWKILKILDQHN